MEEIMEFADRIGGSSIFVWKKKKKKKRKKKEEMLAKLEEEKIRFVLCVLYGRSRMRK